MERTSPPLTIHRGMDVFTSYQDRYLGQVVTVWNAPEAPAGESDRGASARQTGSSREAAGANEDTRLQQEQGDTESPTRVIGRVMLGEEQGPEPTMGLGNWGPKNQSADREYGTRPRHGQDGAVAFAVRPGRYNPLRRRLYIPTRAIASISMERIVVDVEGEEIPEEWRRRPER